MNDILIILLSSIGTLFILVAAIGLLRMPDFYLRQSVTVKAATMGAGFILVAVALYFYEFSTTTKALAIIFFLFVTAPVSGHMVCRAAYLSGTKLWEQSVLDDMEGKFDIKNEILKSGLEMEEESSENLSKEI